MQVAGSSRMRLPQNIARRTQPSSARDREPRKADHDAGRKIHCPMLCLWSLGVDLEQIYGDPVAIWRSWATDVKGYGMKWRT